MRGMFNVALRFSLLEKIRNRFALVLLLIFVPLWDLMLGSIIPSSPVDFRLQSTGTLLQIDGHNLTILTAGLNALTLVVGFMIFAATQESGAFDKRLVHAGLPQSVAMIAKVVAIVAVSAVIALYAALVLLIIWPSVSFFPVWLSYMLDALIYGTLGLLLGVLVNSQLSGFFLIIMISLSDTFLQAPIYNPVANKPALAFFPSYGPMQVGVSGGFGHSFSMISVWTSLAWAIGFGLIALMIFWFRTRSLIHRSRMTIEGASQVRQDGPTCN